MSRIKRALVSVSDKTGVVKFARRLRRMGVEIISTGGTAAAGIKLIEQLGAQVVGCAFVIDLPDLGGRKLLEGLGMDVYALCAFDGD